MMPPDATQLGFRSYTTLVLSQSHLKIYSLHTVKKKKHIIPICKHKLVQTLSTNNYNSIIVLFRGKICFYFTLFFLTIVMLQRHINRKYNQTVLSIWHNNVQYFQCL